MSQPRPARVSKRVERACDYCRKKRLKCTEHQRPCLNCQLYNAECISSDRGRRDAIRKSRSDISAPSVPYTAAQQGSSADSGIDVQGGFDSSATAGSNTLTTESESVLLSADIASSLGESAGVHDFSDTLRQAGLGFSSNFWAWDRPGMDDFSTLDPFMGNLAQPNDMDIEPLLGAADSQYRRNMSFVFTTSARRVTSASDGKVSSVNLLTQTHGGISKTQGALPPGIFIRKDEAVANHIGFSSVGATLALCVKDALESQQNQLTAGSMSFLIEAGPHVDEVGLLSSVDLRLQKFALQGHVIDCINAYFTHWNPFFPILDETQFRNRLKLLDDPCRQHPSVWDYCIFNLVVSLGAVVVNIPSAEPGSLNRLASDSYQEAWSMIHDIIASPCEASVQVILLHIIHQLHFGRHGVAWVFSSFAIRIAQSLGLHRQMPNDMAITDLQLLSRSQLWWIAFAFDASLSLSQGRPTAVIDGTYDVEIPFVGPASESTERLFPTLSEIYTWKYRFVQIQNRFCSLMYSKRTAASRLDAFSQIDSDLAAWKDSLPRECQPGSVIVASEGRYAHVLLLHLDYYNLYRALHWAAIPLASASDYAEHKLRVRTSEALCLHAARSYIELLNESIDALQGKEVFPKSLHTIDYMAAIATLYRNISKNPSKLSARADLEYLRAGKIHLEQDIPEGVVGPSLQALFVDMLTSAEEIVQKNSNVICKRST